MDVKFLIIAVTFAALAVALGATITHQLERRAVRNRYEWLLVLDWREWRYAHRIRTDMSRLKNKKMWGSLIYTDLARLEKEGLVEAQRVTEKVEGYQITTRLYRLTSSGIHQREEDAVRQFDAPLIEAAHRKAPDSRH